MIPGIKLDVISQARSRRTSSEVFGHVRGRPLILTFCYLTHYLSQAPNPTTNANATFTTPPPFPRPRHPLSRLSHSYTTPTQTSLAPNPLLHASTAPRSSINATLPLLANKASRCQISQARKQRSGMQRQRIPLSSAVCVESLMVFRVRRQRR